MRRPGLLAAALLALLLPGCMGAGQPDAVRVPVFASNPGSDEVELLVKAWDHDGVLRLNVTTMLPAAASDAPVATLEGPVPRYGAEYTWFAQAGEARGQESRSPGGLARVLLVVEAGAVEFHFA